MSIKSGYLLVSTDVLPEVFLKVLEAKEMIESGSVSGVSEAVKLVDISRSTYYKYCDHISRYTEHKSDKIITFTLVLVHKSGVLSRILTLMAGLNCNILTMSQEPPKTGKANATMKLDITNITVSVNKLVEELKSLDGVKKIELVSIEGGSR